MPVMRKVPKFGSSMKHSDLLKSSRGVFIIGRHSDKGPAANGLSAEGEKRAAWAGKNLPKGYVLHMRHPAKPRHAATAGIVFKEYQGEKGTIKELDSLNFENYVSNMGEFDKIMAKFNDPKTTQMWINGEIDSKIANEATHVGKSILTDVNKQFLENEVQGKKNLMVAVTSSGAEGSIMKFLGIDPLKFKAKKSLANRSKERRNVLPQAGELLRFTEGMVFFVGPKNELIMRFRGRPFRIKQVNGKMVAIKA